MYLSDYHTHSRLSFDAHAPLSELAEAAADAHINARGLVPDVPLPLAEGRTVRQLGCPIKLSDCPAAYRHAGYPEGWHTEAVLTGLGYTAEEIRDLSE